MANFIRFLAGLVLLPTCWGVSRTFFDALSVAADREGVFSVETMSLLGGILAFAMCWAALAHPVKAYVLGHELTHALWGLAFGARPSDLRVGDGGGSVRLTKSNLLITLAPYFFPFYTFVVVLAAVVTSAFMRPLPCLPLWLFLIGFTWSFHVLFTLQTLTRQQPDVKLYGRVFSWVVIFLVNVALVLVWLATTTPLTFGQVGVSLMRRTTSAYLGVGVALRDAAEWAWAARRG